MLCIVERAVAEQCCIEHVRVGAPVRMRAEMPMLSGHFFASLLLLMWYQYGQNTSPTVYITAIQMAPSGERFFKSSCAPLLE